MNPVKRRAVWGGVVLATAVLAPGAVMAQGDTYVKLLFSTAQVYDGNLFGDPAGNRESDVIFRVSPAVETGYLSVPFTLSARYTFDADRYVKHPALSKTIARQAASMELRYLPKPRLVLSFNPSYVQTQWPSEFNLDSRLAVRRAYAERLAVASSMSYEWKPLTRVNLDYGFVKDAMAGGIAIESQSVRIGFDRRTSDRNLHRIDYRFSSFGFGDWGTEASHLVSFGSTREITKLTSVDIGVGPRFLVRLGAIRPELSVSLRHRLQNGELDLNYSRTQATAIGSTGILNLQAITLPVSYQPTRRLTLTGTPAFVGATLDGRRFSIYTLDFEAVTQAARRLSVVAYARIGLQQARQVGRREEVPNRMLSLKLVTTLPS